MVWNQGVHFTQCEHCGLELVRKTGGHWRPLRKREKIVSRAAGEVTKP